MSIKSPAFGLKEFADGELTLCTPKLEDSDFEGFERWLAGVGATCTVEGGESGISSEGFSNRTVPSLESLEIDLMQFDYTADETFANSSQVVFEEDPLSCLLNTSSSIHSQEFAMKKRGRKPKTDLIKRVRKPSFVQKPVINNAPKVIEYRQKRFSEDLYSPLMVRGRGSEREGCCPLCMDPPVWLKIKQSAYWYHMNFFHGISASTGRPYPQPLSIRQENVIGKPEMVRIEGFCQDCNEWQIICAESPKQSPDFPMNSWYKHSQKCLNRIVTDLEYPSL